MKKVKKARALLVTSIVLIASACAVSGSRAGGANDGAAATSTCPNRGQMLFATHCAVCHGVNGRGDGTAAYLLSPIPRDFSSARFRLVSTANGVPTEQDLVETLRRGMPGSAMPPWEWMPESDLRALARYVRELSVRERAAVLRERAQADDEVLSAEEALALATRAMTPGEPVRIPQPCGANATGMQEARRFYVQNCALCHGVDGTGRNVKDQVNEDGTPTSPRDFTAGIFKGGSTYEDIARRMLAGLPGSPMPATTFKDDEQAARVATYVANLVRPGVQERVSQHRQVLVARRVHGSLPADVGDEAWSQATACWVPLMPLWWNDLRTEGCVVRALHDGERLALKLSWEDATKDAELLGTENFTDAVALQWSREPNPPLFSMGEKGLPVNIWQWKAGWELDLGGVRDVAARYPNTPADQYGLPDTQSAPLYITGRAVGNTVSRAERRTAGEMLSAEGFGTLAPIGAAGAQLSAHGAWAHEFWDVVFTRPLAACCPGELPLGPGESVFLATAIWNGAANDRNGQKSVSVWHVLQLEQ